MYLLSMKKKSVPLHFTLKKAEGVVRVKNLKKFQKCLKNEKDLYHHGDWCYQHHSHIVQGVEDGNDYVHVQHAKRRQVRIGDYSDQDSRRLSREEEVTDFGLFGTIHYVSKP